MPAQGRHGTRILLGGLATLPAAASALALSVSHWATGPFLLQITDDSPHLILHQGLLIRADLEKLSDSLVAQVACNVARRYRLSPEQKAHTQDLMGQSVRGVLLDRYGIFIPMLVGAGRSALDDTRTGIWCDVAWPVFWGRSPPRMVCVSLARLTVLLSIPLPVWLVVWYRAGQRRRARIRDGRCLSCGYDLTGLAEPRCPECSCAFIMHGQPQPERAADIPWPVTRADCGSCARRAGGDRQAR
ncbi:MAG: hypothetical protein GY842_28775 [bacterium]|nr:hypothetical protein [bacterium]